MGLYNVYQHHGNFAVGEATIPGAGTGIIEIDTGFGLRELAYSTASQKVDPAAPIASAINIGTAPGTRPGHATFLITAFDAAGAPLAVDVIVKFFAMVK